MNTAKLLLASVTLLFFVYSSTAQAIDEHSKKLSHHHTTIIKESGHLQEEKLNAEKAHTEEMGKHIESAKIQHAKLQSNLTPEQKAATKENHEAIEKHHATATASYKVLKDELEKPYPDKVKVKKHAQKVNESITAAEQEHTEIKKKTGVQE